MKDLWNYEVSKIQHDIKNSSVLQGKVITKLSFTIQNKKHVWRKTIEKLPSPLDPLGKRTVLEDFSISKFKNRVTLYPRKYSLVKDGKVEERKP